MKVLAFFALAVILFSCNSYSKEEKTQFDSKIEKYLKKSAIPYKKSESGLYYHILEEGAGDYIKATDEVSFHYTGRLLNGKVFDERFKDSLMTFKVKELIMGWQEAMLYLKKGGKIKLIVPPQLGYGNYDLEKIPQHSTLLFDLEVVEVN